MDLASNQHDKDDGYQTSQPDDYYLEASNGPAGSESGDLNLHVNDNFEVFNNGQDGEDTAMDMGAGSSHVGLGDEQNVSNYQSMRLLHITRRGELILKDFDTRHDAIPPYAVVSYISESDDVVYSDLKRLRRQGNIHTIKRTGWEKVHFCAQQAKHHDLNYFWIESCCVNRARSLEVNQAIEATFERLKNAQTCYVLLSDVHSRSLEGEGESSFRKSTWFTHCWAFLDLLAPSSVEFFSRDGTRLGDRKSLLSLIQEAMWWSGKTLSVADLSLFENLPLSDLDVILNLSQHRRAVCKRNSVYCLLGMLGCSTLTVSAEDKEHALKQLQKATQDKEQRGKIYRSLSAPDPSTNYRNALKQREPGTGPWLLNSTEFRDWRDHVGPSRLWVQGTSGSGKTILSATVIENLQQHCQCDASMVAAYFFFDITDEQKRDARPMLRALIHQLLQNLATIPDDIVGLFKAHQADLEGPQRSTDVLLRLLRHLLSYFTQIYVVLDALDECPKRREVLLATIQQMMNWQSENMHILVTSRRYTELVESLGRSFNTREVVSIEDIGVNIQWRRLRHDERLAKWRDDIALMQEIQTSLAYIADGRYHNVESQLTMLGLCLTREELYESLATLVRKTDDQYDRILCSADQGIAPCFGRMLKWLAFSVRPLRSLNMKEIIALDPAEYPDFDATALEHAFILHSFSRLGIVGSEPRDIMVARQHPYDFPESRSIRQYLLSERIKQGRAYQYSLEEEDCHKTIAKDCLEYLLQQPFPKGIVKASPLLNYAAKFWVMHFRMAGDNKEGLVPLAMRVFSEENSIFPVWICLYNHEGRFGEADLERSLESIATPLYYAAHLGLGTITTLLLQQGADINARGGRYGSPLQAAASKGHLDVVSILLNNGADLSAPGGRFESAIHAARVCGHSSIVELIFEFSKSNAGSNIAPSDSGYASQRQALSIISPSTPDAGIQRDSLTENQSIDQAPSYRDEETYPDDIRSIKSDNESIGSKISTSRSRAELFAVKYLATFIAQLESLRPLHEMALQKIEKGRFIQNYRRILKSYYKRLLKEASSGIEQAVTRVLRSRRNRERIAEGIADQLEFDEENERPSLEKVFAQPEEKQFLEDWLRRMQDMNYEKPTVAKQDPLFSDFQLEDGGSDSGFDTESETEAEDEFTNIDGAERFLQQGLAFHNLVLDIRLLMLPHPLRQIVDTTPKFWLQIIENNETSWVNNAKAFLESHTGYRWDWWPLAPRIPNLRIGEQHLQWKLHKRMLYTEMTQEQAENLRGVLDLASEHPPNCHCCVARSSTGWLMLLKDMFRKSLRSMQSNRQRSATSGNTSSKAAIAYTPSSNNTPRTSSSGATHGTNASGVVPNNNSSNGAGNNLQAQTRTPTISAPNAPKAATRVVFGIQGMRRSLEIEQIEICSRMNDQRFFRELNSRYKKHRWSFQRLLSPFQFQHCNFVKFEKLNVNRVFSFGEGLPDPNGFADDYDYNPKPPQGKIPLIEPGLFAVCLQSCEDDCKWSLLGPWLHDCFQLPPLCDKITCIPKKRSEFAVQCKQILKDTAWGIEAEYTLSFWMLCVYHLIPLLSSFAFWIYWLTKSPGDWQNASVPTITTIALFAFVWVPFGFVFNSHKPVRYR